MAIVLTSNSPIVARTGTIYLGRFKSNEVFWTDDANVVPNYTYIVTRWDALVGKHKVVGRGKLSGKLGSTYYNYRFNFENYIKIDKLNVNNIVKVDDNYSYMDGNNTSKIALLIHPGDVLQININNGNISLASNGEYYLNTGINPEDLTANRFEYTFRDNDNLLLYKLSDNVVPNSIYPVTVYSGTLHTSVTFTGGSNYRSISKPGGYDFRIGLLTLPSNTTSIQLSHLTTSLPTKFVTPLCSINYYYMSIDGFESINFTGTLNESNTVSREDVKIGSNTLITKLKTVKRLIQNTGLNVSSNTMFKFINAPSVYTLKLEGGNVVAKEYILDTNEFEGYNGKSFSNRNLEITLIDPVEYKRITNKEVTFWD